MFEVRVEFLFTDSPYLDNFSEAVDGDARILSSSISNVFYYPKATKTVQFRKDNDTTGFNLYYNNVVLTPSYINAGVVATEIKKQSFLWNTYYDTPVSFNISEIVKDNLSTEYVSPDLTGTTLTKFAYIQFDTVIPLTGNPVIEGKFEFKDNINGLSVIQHLSGIRGIVLPVYSQKARERFGFNVVTARTLNLTEQRKLLNYKLNYSIWQKVELDKVSRNQLLNLIEFSHGRFVIVPISSEPLIILEGNQGSETLVVAGDLSKYFMLYKVDYIMILDKNDYGKYEIKTLEAIDINDNKVILSHPLTVNYVNPIAFPIVFGYIKDYRGSANTFELGSLEIEVEKVDF